MVEMKLQNFINMVKFEQSFDMVDKEMTKDSVYIKVTLPKWLADRLDSKRGDNNRAEYIRKLLLDDLGVEDDPVKWGGSERFKESVKEK